MKWRAVLWQTALLAVLLVVLAGLIWWALESRRSSTSASPALLYLVAAPSGETQVWALDQAPREVARLPGRVFAYTTLPGEMQALYPVARDDGGHDLWRLDVAQSRAQRWLACAPDDCLAPAASPDGHGVAYTRITGGGPRLWWAEHDTTETTPLFPETAAPGHYSAWSPDGSSLAYVKPADQVCIADMETGRDRLCITARMETPPVWSPDGQGLLVTDMRLEKAFANHIWHVDAASGQVSDLTRVFGVEDDAPTWSLDGQWIAFRRKSAGTAMGKQLWVMRADGSDARALTTDTTVHFGPPVWLADGATLLATRYAGEERGLWRISTQSAAPVLVVAEGYLPHGSLPMAP